MAIAIATAITTATGTETGIGTETGTGTETATGTATGTGTSYLYGSLKQKRNSNRTKKNRIEVVAALLRKSVL